MANRFFTGLVGVFVVVAPLFAVEFEELSSGRWALLFVVIPGCPACEKVLPWFSQAAQTFPEIRFLLVTPWSSDELEKLPGAIPVYVDNGGLFGASLGVRRAPTVLLLARGAVVLRLEWPFDEMKLKESLSELLAFQVPDPRALLGKRPPDFTAKTLAGESISMESLSKPLLLVFFNPACPGCWEDFPILSELSKEVSVVLLAAAKLSPEKKDRLELAAGEKVVVLFTEEVRVLQAFQVMRSPTYFLIDGEGVVIWVWEGNLVSGAMEKIREAFKEARN